MKQNNLNQINKTKQKIPYHNKQKSKTKQNTITKASAELERAQLRKPTAVAGSSSQITATLTWFRIGQSTACQNSRDTRSFQILPFIFQMRRKGHRGKLVPVSMGTQVSRLWMELCPSRITFKLFGMVGQR